MSISQKVRDLIADAHAHGYASELPQSLQSVLHAIADHVDGLVQGAAPDVSALAADVVGKLGEQMKAAIGGLKAEFEQALAQASAGVDQRIEAKFAELLAKAAANEPAAASPVPVSADAPAAAAEPAPQA